nr:MAG TPA: hypothetical protein [Caudoviricetes sp.]
MKDKINSYTNFKKLLLLQFFINPIIFCLYSSFSIYPPYAQFNTGSDSVIIEHLFLYVNLPQ